MAEETPENINPATDPQVEDAPSTAVPLAEIDTAPAPVAPATNPEVPAIPVPRVEIPPPPPDFAFRAEQAQQENRWIQAAAANPENIQMNGSVVIDLGDGRRETINRDGSYSISGADGTFRFDAAGQTTSYTTPTIDGISITATTDGVQFTQVQQGPLTTSTITKDGEPISTTVSFDAGVAKVTTIDTVGGQPVAITEVPVGDGFIVKSASTILTDGETRQDPGARLAQALEDANAGVVPEGAQVELVDLAALRGIRRTADGDFVADPTLLRDYNAETEKLREELIAAKEQTAAGIPLSDTQIAALEEQAQVTAAAEQALFEAEQTLAELDPTVVPAGEDPQVDTFVDAVADPLPSLDTVEVAPENVDPDTDPEVAGVAVEEVPLAEVELDPTVVSEADPQLPAETSEPFVSGLAGTDDDPQVPVAGVNIFPEALIYEAGEPPTQDPIVLAQADNIVTDVPLSNIDAEPVLIDPAIDPAATPQDDFVLSAADIDSGDDLDQDPGPGYGDVDEPLDPDILDRANEVEVDPYQDVLGRDLTDEEIQAEDNPIDYDLEEDIDPYNAIADRNLTEEEIAAEDNPIDYSNEVEVSPYEDVLGRDLTEEEIQAEDNPIDYDLENEIDPYSEVESRSDAETLTDEEIDAARADQQIEFGPEGLTTLSSAEAAQQQATLDRARVQATLQQQRKQANDGDWRVKLRLAPGAQYLYRAPQPGILQPLAVTDGVVFPYTPQITTAYKATYSSYDLTHSNYRGYFYQGSQVEDIQISAKFTAQDSNEANYLLAVIHFFRSVTKMFYGKDAIRGAPPPIVFLQGFGEYQFNLAPCVVAQFNYVLPDNVDYIRAGSPNINGTNLQQRRSRQDLPTNPFTSALGRIQSVLGAQGIKKGAITSPPPPPTLGTNRPTYVPTAMDIALVLHPIQSRSQVSKQFSLQQYANGDLLKGGFW